MAVRGLVLSSFYQDSVSLMRIAHAVRSREGVDEAAALMGTPANHAILEGAGLATDETRAAGPNDLVLAARAESGELAAAALDVAREMVSARRAGGEGGAGRYRPRTLEAALDQLAGADLAAISVPGPYAAAETMKALRRGLHVFLFSDNVPLEQEIALKDEAIGRGLLMMGPDCGTAYLDGVGVGFANMVERGRVGCVAAAGTGLQAVACRLGALGEGISHGIGVGGRDLSAEVGGRMSRLALDLLREDAGTEVVVVVSKAIDEAALPALREVIGRLGKPCVVCRLGGPRGAEGGIHWVDTLDGAADAAAALLGGRAWEARPFSDPAGAAALLARHRPGGIAAPPRIAGLYTGGTLAHESECLLSGLVGEVRFNALPESAVSPHGILDLGDDAYTVGRPHPMLDPEARREHLVRVAAMPHVGVILLDLVLGRGAHADPAAPLADAVNQARTAAEREGRRPAFVASVVGTPLDPQDLTAQVARLEGAGVAVLPSNAQAARFAALLVRPDLEGELLGEEGA